MPWYTTRAYYITSLAVPVVFGVVLASYVLFNDRIAACEDPFGITEACLASQTCKVDRCRIMTCGGSQTCVPDVSSTCVLAGDVLEPGECPVNRHPYVFAATTGYIAVCLAVILLYIATRIYIRVKASETYERYPSIMREAAGSNACPTCGGHGVAIGTECTNCGGSGMHKGTMRPIECDVCHGRGRLVGFHAG